MFKNQDRNHCFVFSLLALKYWYSLSTVYREPMRCKVQIRTFNTETSSDRVKAFQCYLSQSVLRVSLLIGCSNCLGVTRFTYDFAVQWYLSRLDHRGAVLLRISYNATKPFWEKMSHSWVCFRSFKWRFRSKFDLHPFGLLYLLFFEKHFLGAKLNP